jgi:hypothetical protein
MTDKGNKEQKGGGGILNTLGKILTDQSRWL